MSRTNTSYYDFLCVAKCMCTNIIVFLSNFGLFNKLEFIGTGQSRSRGDSTCSFVQIAVVAGAKTTRKQQRLYFLFR